MSGGKRSGFTYPAASMFLAMSLSLSKRLFTAMAVRLKSSVDIMAATLTVLTLTSASLMMARSSFRSNSATTVINLGLSLCVTFDQSLPVQEVLAVDIFVIGMDCSLKGWDLI